MEKTKEKKSRHKNNAHGKKRAKLSERARFRKEQLRKLMAELRRLEKEFPTERACIDKIYKMLIGKKHCPKCKGKKFKHTSGSRLANCVSCGNAFSFTAGSSIFNGMKEVRPIFTSVMLTLRDVKFNANQLAKYFKVSYDTTWNTSKKIRGAALTELSKNCKKVSSFLFNKVIQRRSQETAARQHPMTEQLDEYNSRSYQTDDNWFEKKMAEFYGEEDLNTPERKKELAKIRMIYDALKDGPLSSDQIIEKTNLPVPTVFVGLSILTSCKMVGKSSNDLFERLTPEPTAIADYDIRLINKVRSAVKFIDYLHSGISRRYIQLYTADYWCFTDRTKDKRARLLHQFCTNKFNVANLPSYVSPLMVEFAID